MLSLFPALVVIVSLLGMFGQGQRTTEAVLRNHRPGRSVDGGGHPPCADPTTRGGTIGGFALIAGILGALWSASGYVGAFSRAMDRIYEVEEGRPVWKLRPIQLLLTLVGLTSAAAVAFLLAVSGTDRLGDRRRDRPGGAAETTWNIARWPLMLIFVTLAIATLYYAAPNVQQPKFRWISVGAGVAILIWVVASVLFGFYVSNFGSYNKTYGALAGVIVFLLWLSITNLALLFGAETGRRTRARTELQAGIGNAICNCLPATAAAPEEPAKENRTSSAAARCGTPAVKPADLRMLGSDDAGAPPLITRATLTDRWTHAPLDSWPGSARAAATPAPRGSS